MKPEKASILVLDDVATNLDVLRMTLESAGYNVRCYRQAKLALLAAESEPPDLFLLDIKMPKMDGFEVCRRLKASSRLKDIPVVFITALLEAFDKIRAFKEGAADYITKPFEAEEVLARVDTHVRLYRSQLDLERRVRERTLELGTSEARAREIFEHSPIPLFKEDFSAVKEYLDDLRGEGIDDIRAYLEEHPEVMGKCGELVRILDSNMAALELHGAKSKKELRENIAKTFAKESFETFKLEIIAIWEGDRRLEFDAIIKTLTGEPRNVSIRWSVLPGEKESYAEVLLSVLDITDRMRTEAQLRQAQKMETLGQLTGGVAHDFNNVLAVILGNLELLNDDLPPDSPARKLTMPAITAARRGADLTHRLLAFARKQALEVQTIDLRQLLQGMDGMLRRSLGETIDLEMVYCADLFSCEVDPSQLEHVVLNLAVNARHAMPNGGKLTIETANAHIDEQYAEMQNEVTPGQYVTLSISDTGIGMSAEVKSRIFEPFFTTKEVGEGTGLGLSMVYGFVKQSRGHISVYSEEGHGTLFKIYLPRSKVLQTEGSLSTETGNSMARSGEIILVVEDAEDVRALVLRMLEKLGYEVLMAENGEVALQLLTSEPRVDLILVDVVLPGKMGGRELAEKACRNRQGLKVLFMSGYTRNAIIHHGRLDPGVILLQKPFTKKELATKLRQALDN